MSIPLSETSGTILQFGTGRFLRSFVDLFVQEINETTEALWQVAAIQSTGSERARQLGAGCFHVSIRGISDHTRVDEMREVRSVSRALSAEDQWNDVLDVARRDDTRLIVSNTTESGLSLDVADRERTGRPVSFPAKLLDVLIARFEDGREGLAILPCELVDRNASILKELVLRQAKSWKVPDSCMDWIDGANDWCNTLVDRIVSAPPDDHPLLATDPLLSCAEPFALWTVATDECLPIKHPAIQVVDGVLPFSLRKVRILNGAHTALVARALDHFVTVRETMADRATRDWLERLVLDEIVPVVDARVEGAASFAADVFERFENPFLDHRLVDIALHQTKKIQTRLMPTYQEYREQFGRSPELLGEILEGYL